MNFKKFRTLWNVVFIFFIALSEQTNAAWLRCYNGHMNRYVLTSIEQPLVLLNSSCINRALPTVIYTFGYKGKATGPATTSVVKAYLATRKRNVILLDWEDEAKSGLLGIPFGYVFHAVPNAKKIGSQLGTVLVRLAKAGLNMTNIHLIGHSLGAHLMGYAGRHARANGYVVSRITGLDPARALFEGTFSMQTGLDRRCARFVDIIHTDPGGYGTSKPTGTVDLWPNYIGTKALQPGCPVGEYEMFSPEDLCSHDRSWQYYVESLRTPTAFRAKEAFDYTDWLSKNNYSVRSTIFLGELVDKRAIGNFFLSTNPFPPYGRGFLGLNTNVKIVRTKRNQSPLARLLRYI